MYISVVVVGLAVPLRRRRGKEYTLVPIDSRLLHVVFSHIYIFRTSRTTFFSIEFPLLFV